MVLKPIRPNHPGHLLGRTEKAPRQGIPYPPRRLQALVPLLVHGNIGVALVVVPRTRLRGPMLSVACTACTDVSVKTCFSTQAGSQHDAHIWPERRILGLTQGASGREGLVKVLPERCIPQRRPQSGNLAPACGEETCGRFMLIPSRGNLSCGSYGVEVRHLHFPLLSKTSSSHFARY